MWTHIRCVCPASLSYALRNSCHIMLQCESDAKFLSSSFWCKSGQDMKRGILAIGFVLALLLAFGVSRLSAESVLTLEGLATAITRLTISQAALDSRVASLESQVFHDDAYASALDAMPTHDLLQRLYTLRVVTFAESENEGRSTLEVSYVETEQRAINGRIRNVTKAFIDEYREFAAIQEAGYQNELSETGRGVLLLCHPLLSGFGFCRSQREHRLILCRTEQSHRWDRKRIHGRLHFQSPRWH